MEVVRKVPRMRAVVDDLRRQGRPVALVPTMGGLHAGHLSLVRLAKERGAEVVVSLFVNPRQFGEGEDFESYPRDLTRDCQMLVDEGVAYAFAPDAKEMYPEGFGTEVEVTGLSEVLSGRTRPEHFTGVTTVVLKLLNIVRPDVAVFGWKDAQQLVIIQRMVRDLNLPVEILAAPTVRDQDGLAASTRNQYLDDDGRKAARAIHRALQEAMRLVEKGERSPESLKSRLTEILEAEKKLTIDYVEIVRASDLEVPKRLAGLILVLVSVKVDVAGGPPALLIDNVRIEVEEED